MRSFLLASLTLAMSTSAALADDYTFGDELLNWVNTEAATRSRELATADFQLRATNVRIRTVETSHLLFDQIDAALGRIHSEIQAAEAELVQVDPLQAAIRREATADRHLAELMRIHQTLDANAALIAALTSPPDRAAFNRLGLQHVGRASVASSFMGMKAVADSLQGQFGYVTALTIDENGRMEGDVDFQVTGSEYEQAADGIVLAFAEAYPKLAIIYGVLKLTLFSAEVEEFRDQKRKVEEAVALLPGKFLSADAQFRIYSDASTSAQAEFEENFAALTKMSSELRQSVKQLFSLSVARANVARQSLTQGKLELIATSFARGQLRDAINERALIQTARELRSYHENLATREITYLESCGNAFGVAAAENWQDGLAEAEALYTEIGAEGRLAPLQTSITIMRGQVAALLTDSSTEMAAAAAVPCPGVALVEKLSAPLATRPKLFVPDALITLAEQSLPAMATDPMKTKQLSAETTGLNFGFGTCLMHRQGVTYYCGVPGDGAIGHNTRFPGNGRAPQRDVLGSSGDGGYRPVDRDYRAVTAEADQNLRDRTAAMRQELDALNAALPAWQSQNLAAAQQATAAIDTRQQEVTQTFTAYSVALGQEYDVLRNRLMQYVSAPSDLARMGALAGSLGGSDFSLRSVPADRIMPDSPPITGVDAWDRVYANTDLGAKALARELRKFETDRAQVQARFAARTAQGQTDPVFPNEEDLEAAMNMTMTTLAYANAFASPSQDVIDQLGLDQVQRLLDGHVIDAQRRRYHARGLLDYEAPRNLDGIGWQHIRPLVVADVASFMTCSAEDRDLENTPCNKFLHSSLQHIYNIGDFAPDTSRGYEQWMNANEMITFMETSEAWTSVGNAGRQADLNRAGLLASQGRAVVATWANEGGHGHVAIVLPGPPTGRSGLTKWKGLLLPDVANFAYGAPQTSNAETKITFAFGSKDPKTVIFYVRDYPD
ncbi:hypothetical protein JMK10_02355 [Rhodovulum sulfidophilum]|uniref:hypothetical protein n=1 Tax=Rhodovulum sulfidophilum TaxID=35806 RepID=UPI0019235F2F|nr:hypothetical protein [Rhodovulum sulfidophilum]MBL3574315.1 hypothetical protein [Rhodovulum sulfidophilum]MCE8432463.1 hypothetical protein [Rhodovulum sulfidophilum]MCF4115681.1 hypothetical protein [Rhodovulum sulfidophilum]